MTTFSVIIPHRNSLQTLAKAINSVPESNTIEVIVVDNSAKPIKEKDIANDVNRKFELCYSSPLKGAGHARNVGIQHAHGDYLVFDVNNLSEFVFIGKIDSGFPLWATITISSIAGLLLLTIILYYICKSIC